MALIRNEDDTSTLFAFDTKEKLLLNGSLAPNFDCRIKRNRRLNAKDILHKKGVDNFQFAMIAELRGSDRHTNLNTLSALAEAQTTIYLDTEGVHNSYNGKYEFNARFNPEIDEFNKVIIIKFNLIENAN